MTKKKATRSKESIAKLAADVADAFMAEEKEIQKDFNPGFKFPTPIKEPPLPIAMIELLEVTRQMRLLGVKNFTLGSMTTCVEFFDKTTSITPEIPDSAIFSRKDIPQQVGGQSGVLVDPEPLVKGEVNAPMRTDPFQDMPIKTDIDKELFNL